MTLTIIIILLLIGLTLLLAEVLVIPGFGIAGIGGILMSCAGIYMAYSQLGVFSGIIISVCTAIAFVVMLYILSKSKTIDKMKLKSEINSQVGEQDNSLLKIGDEGETITRLNLYGKVKINGTTYQARSLKYIDTKTRVVIVAIENNCILVKQI